MLDTQTRFDLAQAVARQVGVFLRRAFRPTGVDATRKADHTLVTEADTAADALAQRLLRAADPHAAIISEEATTVYPPDRAGAWIVDPLDGTHNFAFGLPVWGVSVAYVDPTGYPLVAAAYFPLLDEMYTAWRGRGAWLNGQRLQVREHAPEHGVALVGVCWPLPRPYRHTRWPWKVRSVGSGVWMQALVARGTTLAAVDCAPRVWDAAAAHLLVEAAGGRVTPWRGQGFFPLQPGVDYATRRARLIAAANDAVLAQVQQVLRQSWDEDQAAASAGGTGSQSAGRG